MARLAEYGAIKGETISKREVIRTEGKYRLEYITSGWEPAGAMARWTDGYWAVRFDCDGAVHGRRFKEYNDAFGQFALWANLNAATT